MNNKEKLLPAYAYVRVSTKKQSNHGYSIGQQITNIMNFAQQHGYYVTNIFSDEGISAKDLNRPNLQELLKICNSSKNEVKAVIVYKLDRISRDIADYTATLKPFFDSKKIKLLVVSGTNGDTLETEMQREMTMVFADYERKIGKIRTKEGLRGKVASGGYPYHAPLGYKNEIDGRYKKMVIDEDYVFYVKRAYALCLQGNSPQTIASILYKEGLRTKKGSRIPKTSIEYILHNRVYTGKFYYEDKLIEKTNFPAIIDEATYFAVQKKLSDPSKTRQTHTDFPYNGCIKCAKCGCQLTGERHKKITKSGVKYYIHYHCTGNRGGDCKKNSYIRQELIDETVLSMLKQITIPSEVLELVQTGLIEIHKKQGTYHDEIKKSIRKRIDKLDDTLRRAFEENFNSAGMKANIEKWEAEREALVMEEHEIQKATKDFYEQSNSLLRFCNDCYKAFLDGSAEQKRKIINIVCSNFTYDGEILYIEPIPAFKVIMQNAQNIKKLPRLDSNQQPFD